MDRNLKIGVVGLGLIGGSIFKALCALKCDVYGVTRSNETYRLALGYTDNVFMSLSVMKHCDVIFVCTPINKTLEVLDKLESIVSSNTIVTDVCSLKEFLTVKQRNYKFIPSHPMAGTENKGFDNSFETLFQDAKWVLTPFENHNKKDLEVLKSIIEVFGANAVISNPKEHDEAVAIISHMPMLVSQAIFKVAQTNKLALKLASSGFRDMTRLALSNEEMANDMVNFNSKNIENAVLNLYSSVGELLSDNYMQQIKAIKRNRRLLYSSDGKNIYGGNSRHRIIK